MKEEAYQDEKRIFIQTKLLKKLVIEYCTYYKIDAFFINEDEIISALERLGVLEINEKNKKRERARKLPFQRENHLRYLYIIKDFLQNKVDEN